MLLVRVLGGLESIELDVAGVTVDLTWYIWILLGGEIGAEELARRRILARRVIDEGGTSINERRHDVDAFLITLVRLTSA